MNRPRVAFVTPTLDVLGGTEQVVGLEARVLLERADVTFFTDAKEFRRVEGAAVVPVSYRNLPGVFGTEAWFVAASRAVREHGHFDAIYSPGVNCDCATHINVYANFSEWVAMHRGVPIRGSLREAQRRLRFQRLAAWERRLYTPTRTRLATISELAARRLREDFGRTDVTVFPSTPEPGRFTREVRDRLRAEARGEFGLAGDAFAVVLLGNAWYSKGFDLIYDAWRGLNLERTQRLLLVTTEREDHLRRMLGEAPLDLRILNRVRQVERLYAAADLVILPSRGETFGLPIAEAGAMHVPVRVSPLAGVSGYVPPECVVKSNTAEAWRAAIGEVAEKPPEPETLKFVADRLAVNDPVDRARRFAEWVLES